MVIKKGDVFECIEDVFVGRSGRIEYFKGKFYKSNTDRCITNESGNDFRWGVSENFFRKLSDVEVTERKNPINENIGQVSDINAMNVDPNLKVTGDMRHMNYENTFANIASGISSLLEYKNAKYGNSALNPIEIFNGKTKVGQRIDDKLSRVKNNPSLQKNDIADLIGYLFLVCKENNWTTFDEFKD